MVAGTVTALRDTGTTINDNPQAAITITYARADGTSARTATVWYVPSTGKAIAKLGGAPSPRAPAKFPDTHYPR